MILDTAYKKGMFYFSRFQKTCGEEFYDAPNFFLRLRM